MRAVDILNGYGSVLLDTTVPVRGEGSAPKVNVTTSVRIIELRNIPFVRYIALPTGLPSHVISRSVGSAI